MNHKCNTKSTDADMYSDNLEILICDCNIRFSIDALTRTVLTDDDADIMLFPTN